MSRSGYSDDGWDDQWAMICYRGAVASAIRGRRGQAFLKELLAAMDAREAKRLIAHELVKEGDACAIGCVALARGVDVSGVDPENIERVAAMFGISDALAKEIVFENDQDFSWRNDETPEARFTRMRNWVASLIKSPAEATPPSQNNRNPKP